MSFTYKSPWGQVEDCYIKKEVGDIPEKHGGFRTRYSIMSPEGSVCTINLFGLTDQLPDEYQRPDVLAIKDYSENSGLLNFLEEQGVVRDILGSVPSGFVSVPIVLVDLDKLENLGKEQAETKDVVPTKETFEECIIDVENQDFSKYKFSLRDKPIVDIKVKDYAFEQEIQIRPIRNEKDLYLVSELSFSGNGVLQEYIAKIDKDKFAKVIGKPFPKEKTGSLKTKQSKNKNLEKDNEHSV